MKNTFAIIGSGYILLKHIEAIRSIGGEITDVINENGGNNWKTLINRTQAKYIIVLTPNYLHEEVARYAMGLGKIVLCEKPFCIKPIKRDYKNVFVVLQLRYHPLVKEMRKLIDKENNVIIDVAVWRDKSYDNGWKGDDKKSGGIYFNLGVHYIDLVYWLCGKNKVNLKVNLTTKSKSPHRIITINGKSFNLSSKENLSEENLHKFVYQDLIKGKGVQPKDLVKLTNEICLLKTQKQ
jgi:UDP-N-acetyl-2-amino-2-deoxyglucuronate dehydrogenase